MKLPALTLLTAATLAAPPAFAQTSPATDANAELSALRQQLQAMQARIDHLEQRIATAGTTPQPASTASAAPADTPQKAQSVAAAASWKGAPLFEDKQSGFSFKPKGYLQFDSGHVGNPEGALAANSLGYRTRARRIIFGAEGSLSAGFGYKAEFNFAGGKLGYEDVILTWQPKGTPVQLTIGNMYPLSGLETISSSRVTSFFERGQANEVFNFNRRIGASFALIDPEDRYILTAGLYQAEIDADSTQNRWQASLRGIWSPTLGDKERLHLGLNYQYRRNSAGDHLARYRTRPFTQITDVRFVDTGTINATGDQIAGAELGAIFGPFHIAGEAHKLWVDGYRDQTGTVLDGAPNFFAGYLEAGFFLTGESRGYKGGKWDRVKVRKPLGSGGLGALQVNARVERIDLADVFSDRLVDTPIRINGGTQTGYMLSMIWNPIDYIRFMLQYSRTEVQGGPSAAIVRPDSVNPIHDRRYGIDSIALRAQVEF